MAVGTGRRSMKKRCKTEWRLRGGRGVNEENGGRRKLKKIQYSRNNLINEVCSGGKRK